MDKSPSFFFNYAQGQEKTTQPWLGANEDAGAVELAELESQIASSDSVA